MKHPLIHPHLLHPLTGQPLQAIGVVNGRTIWPLMGASEDSDDANDDQAGDQSDNSGSDDTDDGDDADANARMLIDERNGRKTAESLIAELTGKSKTEVRKALREGADKAREALIPKKADDDQNDDAPDADAIRRDAEREATERANARIVKAEVKALAAATFADPADAPLYIDLASIEVDDDGEVDADEIKKALKAVLEAKPHLAKKSGPKPDKSQGSRGGSKTDPGPGLARMKQAYADSGTQ